MIIVLNPIFRSWMAEEVVEEDDGTEDEDDAEVDPLDATEDNRLVVELAFWDVPEDKGEAEGATEETFNKTNYHDAATLKGKHLR